MTLPANETTFTLDSLNSSMLYKFYLSAKTIKGPGPTITGEAFTVMDTSELFSRLASWIATYMHSWRKRSKSFII